MTSEIKAEHVELKAIPEVKRSKSIPAEKLKIKIVNRSDAPSAPKPESVAKPKPPADIPLLDQYKSEGASLRKDFTTVDWWWANYKLSRQVRAREAQNREQRGFVGRVVNWGLSVQGWVILMLVGICMALNAITISLTSKWVADLKMGMCTGAGIWNPRDVCCAESGVGACPNWQTWANMFGLTDDSSGGYAVNYFFFVMIAMAFGYLAYWLVATYAKYAGGSGIPEVMIILGGFVIKGYLGARTLVMKSLSLAFAVGAGLNVGKEGPLVHIGAAWGNVLSRPFSKYKENEVKKREVISASAAAGVAAAFGAPMGGVLFSMEAVSAYFPPRTMWRSFWCTVSCVLILRFTDPFGAGRLVEFQASTLSDWKWFELIPFAGIGAVGGILGGIFIRCNVWYLKYKRTHDWLRAKPNWEVVFWTFLTAILSFPNIFMRGTGTALMADLFSDCPYPPLKSPGWDPANAGVTAALCEKRSGPFFFQLIIGAILRFILCIFSITLKVPAGVFVPTMCIGAMFGRSVGWLMQMWNESIGNTFIFAICDDHSKCIGAGIYAVVGAASVIGGVTRLTVSLTVIMFELAGGLQYIIPLAVGLVFSKWTGDIIAPGGLYAYTIKFKGYPYIGPNTDIEDQAPAADIMVANPVSITTYGQTLASLQQLLILYPFHGFPITNNIEENVVFGFIQRSDLQSAVDRAVKEGASADAQCHFSQEPPTVNPPADWLDFSAEVDQFPMKVLPNTPADRVLYMFRSLGLAYCLVCESKGYLRGIIKKKDLAVFLRQT